MKGVRCKGLLLNAMAQMATLWTPHRLVSSDEHYDCFKGETSRAKRENLKRDAVIRAQSERHSTGAVRISFQGNIKGAPHQRITSLEIATLCRLPRTHFFEPCRA